MRRTLEDACPRISFLLRPDPRLVRKLPLALMLIAVGLSAWVLELGSVLQGQAQVRNWSSVWVGLDLMEIAGLTVTAILLRRRSAYLAVVAAVTATLFALDAWFDVLTAAAGASWYESLADAFFGEIPMTALLTAIAVWATRQRLSRPDQSPVTERRPRASSGYDRYRDDRRPA
jgi:hypothetical protein